ncbi:MAG: 5 protein, partial [Parcubacteria group bacterium]|nr:5 protein [Parcubacteria group bacterium]
MPETPNWQKHFAIRDIFKKKPLKTGDGDLSSSFADSGMEATSSERDPQAVLSEKKEQAIQALLAEYTRLKQVAIAASKDNNPKDALEILAQAEGFLSRAEKLNVIPIIQTDIASIDEILAQYPLPHPEAKSRSESAHPTDTISATTLEGKEISFDIKERLRYWGTFYRENKIDWVSLPESIPLTSDQIAEMTRLMEQGFNHMIIIPENLVSEPTIATDSSGKPTSITNPRYEQLHTLMSEGYNPTFTGGNYDADGKFQGSKDKTSKLRIILTKDVQNLKDDPVFNSTLKKSIEDLEKDELTKYTGLSESSYLVYQREYHKRTGKHLDEDGWTWLPESTRPVSRRVP